MSEEISAAGTLPRLSAVADRFLLYAQAELQFAPRSLIKYRDCIRQIQLMIGDRPMDAYGRNEVLLLKSCMLGRGHSVARQVSILSALKRVLHYCREHERWSVLDPEEVLVPRRPRREVVYLTPEEVQRFVSVIPLTTARGKEAQDGLRFRALVEALLGSAMRISELLSLDWRRVDFSAREATIVGKGNKERVVFFSERAISWLRRYLQSRRDDHPALFVCRGGKTRLKQPDIWRPFFRYRQKAGLTKRVTPHLLRHTAATQLLFNGCPVGHIKEILGHERLETTCRYYLGLDHRAAKQAHERFLVYPDVAAAAPGPVLAS
jgi:integrase/recombinase XerD